MVKIERSAQCQIALLGVTALESLGIEVDPLSAPQEPADEIEKEAT